jgi:cell division protein FtsB
MLDVKFLHIGWTEWTGMNATYLLKSNTLWTIVTISASVSACVLLVSSDGLYSMQKRQVEMTDQQYKLNKIRKLNLELTQEVNKFAAKDPELYEALARQQGLARPGEIIYTFRDPVAPND